MLVQIGDMRQLYFASEGGGAIESTVTCEGAPPCEGGCKPCPCVPSFEAESSLGANYLISIKQQLEAVCNANSQRQVVLMIGGGGFVFSTPQPTPF